MQKPTERYLGHYLLAHPDEPWMLVECKLSADQIPRPLEWMADALGPEHSILVKKHGEGARYRVTNKRKHLIIDGCTFLRNFV